MKTPLLLCLFTMMIFATVGTAPVAQAAVVLDQTTEVSGVILDVDGTPSNATITASVVGNDVFQSDPGTGVLDFILLPLNASDINVFLEGPLGGINPWRIRAPADGSALNIVRLSSGDGSDYQLDQNNPITSSSMVTGGDITDLAVLDGVTSFMTLNGGTGPDVNVTLNYNVVDDPVQTESSTWGQIKADRR